MDYHAPGMIPELSQAAIAAWNTKLIELIDGQIDSAKRAIQPAAPKAWMFNAISAGTEGTTAASIDWVAFPKRVSDSGLPPRQGWKLVDDDRNKHEEYCEWEVARDSNGGVLRVTLTCETEDYYGFLFDSDKALVLSLYQKHVSPQVQLAHLQNSVGDYDPQNIWNFPQNGSARGLIMHMGQRNNSFAAAVKLSAVATWPRIGAAGSPAIGEQELIKGARFGEPARHSDPHIGSEINKLVRAGNEVSFADPVGLYIDRIDLSDFKVPGGVPASKLMRVVRGSQDAMLRVIFEAPAGSTFSLGDVKIGGENIRYGSQIAEKTHVRITGLSRPAGQPAPLIACDNKPVHSLVPAANMSAELLTAPSLSRLQGVASSLSIE